jgi:hypothetical protein
MNKGNSHARSQPRFVQLKLVGLGGEIRNGRALCMAHNSRSDIDCSPGARTATRRSDALWIEFMSPSPGPSPNVGRSDVG